jgi:hypothetical protein
MTQSSTSSLYMRVLAERIHSGRCVPFLGAGVNAASAERAYKGLLLGQALAGALAQEIKDMDWLTNSSYETLDLAEIAQMYQLATDRAYLEASLKRILADEEVEPSPLLRILAKLPFRLVVTTNYDRLLERALAEAGQPFKVVAQPTSGSEVMLRHMNEELAEYREDEGTVVYKLHGTFASSGADAGPESSVIITEDDYIDFLAVIGARQAIPPVILGQMTYSTWLLLGYSARDWDFRLIQRTQKQYNRHTSFAVLKHPDRFWVEYLKLQGITVFDIDIYEFAEQLAEAYERSYG